MTNILGLINITGLFIIHVQEKTSILKQSSIVYYTCAKRIFVYIYTKLHGSFYYIQLIHNVLLYLDKINLKLFPFLVFLYHKFNTQNEL